MSSQDQRWLYFKHQGDTYLDSDKLAKAIESYNNALRHIRTSANACGLLICRSKARLRQHAYDAAFLDAKAALDRPPASLPPNSVHLEVLLCCAKAEYGRRHFREAYSWVKKIVIYYPSNHEGLNMVKMCTWRLAEHESGIFDWDSMFKEAVNGTGEIYEMDHADYTGPIEVRQCQDERCGRGLFVTRDVEPGELLLVEKAFAAAFANEEIVEEASSPDTLKGDDEPEPKKESSGAEYPNLLDHEESETGTAADKKEMEGRNKELRAELFAKTMMKLGKMSSLRQAFADLYSGPDAEEKRDAKGNAILDDAAVHQRIAYNAFAFPLVSLPQRPGTFDSPDGPPSRGIWLQASYVNHSCYPLIRRSFIGPFIIFRAQAHIPANTELKFGYISGLETVVTRRKLLSQYGFTCNCQVCIAEAATPPELMERRREKKREIVRLLEAEKVMDIGTYLGLLEDLDDTYHTEPTVEPRQAVVRPVMFILAEAKSQGMWMEVVTLVTRLLRWLGFHVEMSMSGEGTFEVTRFGFLHHEIVIALVALADAFGELGLEGCGEGAESVAKKCYLIMSGEDASWETVYEVWRKTREEDRVEDLMDEEEALRLLSLWEL